MVIGPAWPNVKRAFEVQGAEVVHVDLDRTEGGWALDLDRLFAACGSRVRLIYLASRGNPTGWAVDANIARDLIRFARGRGIAVLCDEVYHRLVGSADAAFSIHQVTTPEDPVFVVNSFSKSYAMTGWRVGWLTYPQRCQSVFEKLIEFSNCGGAAFVQHGALAALQDGEPFIAQMRTYCRAGQRIVAERLATMPGIRVLPGEPGFFTLFRPAIAGDRFCAAAMAQTGVALAPGSTFGTSTLDLVRICHARRPELLVAAMDRLQAIPGGTEC